MPSIITVERLSKLYHIGASNPHGGTLRESVRDFARNPLASLMKMAERGREELWSLKDVSFEVGQGEIVGLIGSNGAGKSTLLKILSRITEPTTGRVRLYGRVGSLLEVGTGFHPELTGRENIFLNGAILGMRRQEIERKFDEIIAFSEIERFIDTAVKYYSSGMYMRLAFAIAAHLETEILIVDEVLAVGDADFQKKCLGKMGEVTNEGRTVLFVSHNMNAVRALCGRVIWLDKGEIVKAGETEQVVLNYLQKGAAPTLEHVWDDPMTAPGNEKVRLRSARVRLPEQGRSQPIFVNTPFQIEFEFWNYLPGAVLNFTMHLYTQGAPVFSTASEVKPRPGGLLREVVSVPANFLNDELYSVTIQVVQDTTETLYLHPEVLTFEVQDVARPGDNWFGKWPGVIRPNLAWVSQDVAKGGAAWVQMIRPSQSS
ncbi:MAG: ATP-binding cassette domain-containing protein [Acidobacteria bacterium]|nr:ATP-binding cassette domain-containing protein [Acidobacteriota bacterium]